MHTLPQGVQDELRKRLGDNETTRSFINMVGCELGKFDDSKRAPPLPKMRQQDADYKQIDALHKKTVELYRAIKAMGDTAWERLSREPWISPTGPPSRERSIIDALDLETAAAGALEWTFSPGEKGTLSAADIARVRIIAFCWKRRGIEGKITAAEDSPFHDTVQLILGLDKSAKALIQKILTD